ncbi:predicted ORF [Xanthomonas phage XacN1]|nr:predicted ORF [Xanthomonas phage XacN1]BBA65608.1 predicted ORF [Xanthomonas phage XacN1]
MRKTMSLDDMFNEVEQERAAQAQAELAKEQQAWDALSDAERERINAERTARIEGMFDAAADAEDDSEEEDDEDTEDD